MADISQPTFATAHASQAVPAWLAPLALLLITIFGGHLRFSGLASQPLSWTEAMRWLDNSGTFVLARGGVFDQLVRLSAGVFGPSEWAIRFPAAFAGALSIPAIYWLSRMLAGQLPALLASLLLAGSVFHIALSQSAGPATLVVLLTILFAGSLLAWSRGAMVLWPIAAMLAGAFAAATAFGGMLSVAAFALGLLVVRLRWRDAISVGIAPLLALIIATAVLTFVLLVNAPGEWPAGASAPGVEQVLHTLQTWASGPHLLAVVLVGIFLALHNMHASRSATLPSAAVLLLTVTVVVPIILLLALHLSPEALAPVLPFALLLASIGLFSMGRSPREPAIAAAIAVVLLAISLLFFAPKPGENWQQVADRLAAQLGPDDCLVVSRERTARPLLRYLNSPPACFNAEQRLTKSDAKAYAGRTTLLLLAHAPRPAVFLKAMGRTHKLKESRIGPVRILAFTPKPPKPPKAEQPGGLAAGALRWFAASAGT